MDFSAKNDGPGMNAYRSTSLFQPHRARQAIRDAHAGKIAPLMGMYLGVSTIPTARLVAPLGYDAVWVDWEHSSCGVETMTTMVHEIMFMSEGRSMPFVRVPGHDHAAIGFALDAGASIICPQIDTVEQAKHIVSAAKFGAKVNGTRSAPPFRLIPGVTDVPFDSTKTLHENLNEQAAIVIQIETVEGVNNLDAILTECPEIDAVWFGTLDCRISMGLPGNMGMGGGEPEWLEAQAKYNATLEKHNKPSSGFALGPAASTMGAGKSFIIVAADVMAIASTTMALNAAREMFPASLNAAKAINGKSTNGVNGHVSHTTLDTQSIEDRILMNFPFPVPSSVLDTFATKYPKATITHRQVLGPIEPEAYLNATILVTWGSLPPNVECTRNLRLIHFLSAGVDQFLTHSVFTDSGVPITNSSGIHGPPIAEWVFMAALNFTRKHSLMLQWQSEKAWPSPMAMIGERDLYGQKIGILGYGAIGQQIGRVAKSMGMDVVAFTRSPRSKGTANLSRRFLLPGTADPGNEFPSKWYHGTDKASVRKFLSCGLDVLVLAMALTSETKAMIGAEELALLKKHSPDKTVLLVNIARGGVVDESALLAALEDSKDSVTMGAALDVTELEPLPKDSRLWEAPNCFVTPHISSVGKAYFARSFQILEANLGRGPSERFLNVVETSKGY